MVFVNLDIGTVIWGDLIEALGFTVQIETWSFGVGTAGLAVGCILFIPFALKFGRRPVYIASLSVNLAMAIWSAKMQTRADLWGTNIVSGLAGALSETICQMSIADLFFLHQRGTANGFYVIMVNVGAFLGPVASGYSAESQGWRW
jgi:MFS family permease